MAEMNTLGSIIDVAKVDLSGRAGCSVDEISLIGAAETEFPDGALGAPVQGEMAAMMITSGWRIVLEAAGEKFEYRADPWQLRLVGLGGVNYRVSG